MLCGGMAVNMNGYERRTHKKRELILKTAQQMFFVNGVANTSVSDIAQKAEVSKVTIFKYFESKENLLHAVMNRYMDKYIELGESILSGEGTFEKKLETLFSLGKNNYSLLENDVFNSEIWKEPAMQQVYSETVSKAMPFIFKFFEQGKKEGAIDPSIPIEAILAFVAAMSSLKNPGKHNANKEYIVGINKLFYYGLFGDKTDFDEKIKESTPHI